MYSFLLDGDGNVHESSFEQKRVYGKYSFLDGFIDISITVIIIMVMFIVWDVAWTNIQGDRHADQLQAQVDENFAPHAGESFAPQPPGVATPISQLRDGKAFSRMVIPALGSDWSYAAVQGVSNAALLGGLGHYTQTQMPGEFGNTVFAGHRDGRGAPFINVEDLKPCDAIVVETETEWLTYRIVPNNDGSNRLDVAKACMPPEIAVEMSGLRGSYGDVEGTHITTPHDRSVLAPMPGDIYSRAEEQKLSLLTITTCHPMYSNVQRFIVTAVLVDRDGKHPGFSPAALQHT